MTPPMSRGGQVKVDEVYVTFSKEFLDALPASSDEFVVSFEATDAAVGWAGVLSA